MKVLLANLSLWNGSSRWGMRPPIQRRLGVEDVLAFIPQCCLPAPNCDESACFSMAKAVSSLHADGQLGSEHA